MIIAPRVSTPRFSFSPAPNALVFSLRNISNSSIYSANTPMIFKLLCSSRILGSACFCHRGWLQFLFDVFSGCTGGWYHSSSTSTDSTSALVQRLLMCVVCFLACSRVAPWITSMMKNLMTLIFNFNFSYWLFSLSHPVSSVGLHRRKTVISVRQSAIPVPRLLNSLLKFFSLKTKAND